MSAADTSEVDDRRADPPRTAEERVKDAEAWARLAEERAEVAERRADALADHMDKRVKVAERRLQELSDQVERAASRRRRGTSAPAETGDLRERLGRAAERDEPGHDTGGG